MNDEKENGSERFLSWIYQDEPIRRTAGAVTDDIPQKYRDMKKIARNYDAFRQSEEWLFYTQGKFMEDFEDDFEYQGVFERYFPTYRDMNDRQLRGYFTWRTKVRHGIVEQTSLSFVFVYLYELLNLIGVEFAEEGYVMLKRFWDSYREYEPFIDRYVRLWLGDFVVYYNLDRTLLEELSDTAADDAMLVLLHYDSYSEEEVFSALTELSSYNPERSKFYRQYPDDFRAVACKVFARLSEYYKKKRKISLWEKLFGRKTVSFYYMFGSALFYGRMNHPDCEYVVNDFQRYICKNGKWLCERISGSGGKNKELGSLLKTVDCLMRRKYEFKFPVKQDNTVKYISGMIEKEIDQYLELKKKNSKPDIEIDISKLQGIRQAADITRDKLIVEEEPEDGLADMSAGTSILERPAEPVIANRSADTRIQTENEAGLSETEYSFLRCLICGGNYDSLFRDKGVMPSILVDSINEKLFDRFGDTVIIFDGGMPELIEDYRDELKGIIKE